jgi:hypothetical protein
MKMKRSLSVLLSVCMFAASLSFTACDGDAVRKTREAAERLVIYSDLGLKAVDELKATGALTGYEAVEQVASQTLVEVRDATLVFIEKAKTFTKFDARSREDLAKLFVAVTDALERLKPKIAFVVGKVIEYLNARGVTNIKDPQKIINRVNFALNVLDASAKLIQTRIAP